MLSSINLDCNLTKKMYKEMKNDLEIRLARLQREAREKNLPVMIVFEGWGASGKGTLISQLIHPMDPRGFKVLTIGKQTEEEKKHPDMWRFWIETPEAGRIHLFDRSWYRRVTNEQMDSPVDDCELINRYNQIMSFEEQLTTDGTLIIKLFLHISEAEQEKRFKKLEASKETAWRVNKEDKKHHKQYKEYLKLYDQMLQKTDSAFAPWYIIEATDREYAAIKVMQIVADAMEQKLYEEKPEVSSASVETSEQNLRTSILEGVDVTKTLTKEEYKKKLNQLQDELEILHNEMYLKKIPVIIALEGWDAAGKGGAIKRLTEPLDPRGYEVVPISSPTETEKKHHYLWRFWNKVPKDGHLAIFDRTWYGRVLVERIEGFCTSDEWHRAYREINQMEADFSSHGVVVIKFWLHIDKDEQERRFNSRMENPDKQWKITDEDWRNRSKWDAYGEAVDEMLLKTSTEYAPWVVVEADSKYYARIKILETVVDRLKRALEASEK